MKVIKKYTTKTGAYFTINIDVYAEFTRLASEKSINKASLIEKFMERWILENKENKEK